MAVPQGIKVPFELSKTRGSPVVAQGNALLESSILTILRTVPGERPYRPTFGSWLPMLVFENMSEAAALQAVAEARRALVDWEERITVQDILFELDVNRVYLTVVWRPNDAASVYRTTIEYRT